MQEHLSFSRPSFLFLFIIVIASFLKTNDGKAQIVSIQNGDWGNTATWAGGVVPTAGDNVEIHHQVDIKNFAMQCNNLTIKSSGKLLDSDNVGTNTIHGTLSVEVGGEFTPANSTFEFGGNITNDGIFQMGTNAKATTKTPTPSFITITANEDIIFDSFEFYSDVIYSGTKRIIFKDDYYTADFKTVTQNNPIIIFEGFDVRFNGTFIPNSHQVIFQGSINQEVGGEVSIIPFHTLKMQKSSGTVTFLSSVEILNTFELNNDIVICDNIRLGDFSSNVPGTFSYTSGGKIVGGLGLIVNNTGTYNFPVASSSGVENPVTVQVAGSPSFGIPSNIYVSAFSNSFNDAGMVNPAIATGMYWNIDAENITGANFVITGRYSNIQGTESSYIGGYRIPSDSFWRTAGSSVNPSIDEVVFTFTGVNAPDISGFYAAGELSAFLPGVTISAPSSIQPPTSSLYANTINNPIYKIQIDVTGANVTLDEVQLSTSGSYTSSDVVRFKLFRTSTSFFNASHPVGTPITSTSTGSGETLNFTSLSTTLPVGTHYIWLAADITLSPNGSRTLQVNTFTPSSDILFLETIDLTPGTVNNGNLFLFNPTIGLYYSNNNSTDFTNTSGWGTNPDGSGSTPFPPAFTSGNVSFFINNGHTKNANAVSINIKELMVEGTFQDNNSLGTNTFNGLVEVRSGGNFIPNQSDHFFKGGIVNNGTFSMGDVDVTFNTNLQDLVANEPMSFYGKITFDIGVNLRGTSFNFTKTGIDHSISSILRNYATVTVAGGLIGTGMWENRTGGVLKYNSPNNLVCSLDATFPDNLVEYGSGSDQTIKATVYRHLTVSGGGIKSLAGVITVNGNLSISSGVTLDAANSSHHINLNGNWINNGTFLPASNTVTFSSTSNPQTITGTTTFYDLVINNTHSSTPTVTLNDAITVTYNLNLVNGRLVLGDYDVSLTNPVVSNQIALTNGWIQTTGSGRLIRNGSGSDVEFPVGDAVGRRLVTMVSTGAGANWARFTTSISPSITGSNPAAGMWIIECPTGSTHLKFSNVGGTADATSRIHYDNGGTWTLVDTKTLPLPPPYETVNPESFTGTSRTYTVFTPSPPLYSRKSGDWNDISPGDGTWSLVSHTGPSCDCVPTASNNVFIDKDHEVTIPTGYTALAQNLTLVDKGSGTNGGRLKVEGTGVLQANTLTIGDRAIFFADNTPDNLVGTVNGTTVSGGWGTLRSSKAKPFQVSPGGTFMSNLLNVFEYTGGSYTLNTGYITNYPTLLVTATGLTFANEDVTVSGNFIVETPNSTDVASLSTTSSSHQLTVQGNLELREGILELGRMGITVNGTTTIQNGATLRDQYDDGTGASKDNHTFLGTLEVQSGGTFLIVGLPIHSFNTFGDNITNGGTFSLGDNAEYRFQKTSGTLTITPNATMTFASPNNGKGMVMCNVTILDGNGDVALNSNSSTPLEVQSGRTLTNQNGGTGILITDMISGAGTFVNGNNARLSFKASAAPSISTFTVNSAGNTVTYDRGDAQTVRGGEYHHIEFGGSGNKTLDADLQVRGDFTLSGGTFVHNNRRVTFSGTSNPQTIVGVITFYDLDINNTHSTPTVTLNNPATVTRKLDLINGRLVLGSHDISLTNPTVADQLSWSGGWIQTTGLGRLIRNGSGSDVEFPVGDAVGRRLVTMGSTGAGANWAGFTTSISPSITGSNPAAGMWIIECPTGSTHLKFSNVGGTADATSRIYYDNGGTWTLVDTKTSPLPPPYETVNPESFTGTSRTYTVFTPPSSVITVDDTPTVNAGDVLPGTTDVVLYALQLTVSGSDNTLNSVSFTFAGASNFTNADFSDFRLYYSTNNTLDLPGDVQLGSIQSPANQSSTITFSASQPLTVSGSPHYLFVVSNVTAGATSGRSVSIAAVGDASLVFADDNDTYTSIADGGVKTVIAPVFYSQGSGNFSALSNWNTNPSGGGLQPLSIHLTNGTASYVVQDDHSITADVALNINNLTISEGTLALGANNFTVNGTTTVSDNFTDAANNGINTFVGLVTNNGVWTSTSVTTPSNLTFQGGITNNGTFNAGAATFDGGTQSISGSSALTFASPVHLTGGVVLTNNTDVTLQGGGTLSSGTQWIQAASASAILKMDNNWTGAGTLNAAGVGNTVSYQGASTSVFSTTYYHLTISGGGTKSLAGTITVNGNLSILSGTNFAALGFAIDLKGNWINNHTFTPSGNTVTFSGTSPQTIGGTGTITFHNLVINNTHSTPTVTLNNSVTVNNDLTFNSGILRVSDGTTLTVSGATSLTGTGTNILEMEATGTFVGSSPTYNTGKILRYINPNNTIKTIGNEFPSTMNGNVEINLSGASAALNLTGAHTITGNFTFLDGKLNISNSLSLASSGTHALATSAELDIQSGGNLILQHGAVLTNNTANLNVLNGGIVTCQGTGGIATNSPTYAIGSALHYTQSGDKTVGVEFPATMNGDVVINKLSNTDLVTLNGVKTLNGNLTLNTGKLVLGANNLILGTSASISGANINKFIVCNSSGKLIKNFAVTGSPAAFDFPVGNVLYSPITLSYTSITTSGSLEVGLAEVEHPSVLVVNKSLKRYWQLTSASGLTFTGTGLTFNYRDPDDIAGSEASYVTARFVSGNWITDEGTVNPSANTFTQPFISNQIPDGDYTAGEVEAFVIPATVNISTSNPSDITAEPSETNHVVYRIQLEISTAPATLTGLTLTTNGTYATGDLTNFKLYLSSDVNWDLSDVQLGTSVTATSAGQTIFFSSLSQNLAIGTHYLLATADIATTPVISRIFGINSLTLGSITFVSAIKNDTGITAGLSHVIVPTGGVTMPLGNRGIYFDGVNDYVSVSPISLSNATLEAWIKPKVLEGGVVSTLATHTSGQNGFLLEILSDGQIRASLGEDGDRDWVSSGLSNVVEVNKWSHVACTYDGTTLRLYLNGVLVNSIPSSRTPHPRYLSIGSIFDDSWYFQGQIDEVRVFNVARSESEIQLDMATTTPNGAVGYWNFDQSTGVTATDLGSGGNNGALTNNPLWALRVTNTIDDNIPTVGSLRWTITEANTDTDMDYIDFTINNVTPTTHMITLGSTLTATESIFIDGYSALGSSVNTNATGTNATLRINITGTSLINGLVFNGSGSIVRGLAVYGNITNKVVLGGAGSHIVQGCFVGTNDLATTGFGGQNGLVVNTPNNLIGGIYLADRNLISGNAQEGMRIGGNNNMVYGNYFGTQKDGTTALANAFSAVLITTGSSNMIGGVGIGEANVMRAGLRAVFVQATGQNNNIRGNSMVGHSDLSIDLSPIYRTTNDTGTGVEDDDTGANRLQNFPLINLAQVNAGDLTVNFNVPSRYVATPTGGQSLYPLTIDFYKSDGGGDAETYLGTVVYTNTQALTNVNVTFSPLAPVAVGDKIVASATDANGNTSEFSDEIVVTGIPNLTFTTSPVITPGNIIQGEVNRILYATRISNDATAPAVLQAVRFRTTAVTAENTFTSSDITTFRVYASDDNTLDVGDTQLGGGVTGIGGANASIVFTGANIPYNIPANTTKYLFLVADVSVGATPGRTVTIDAPTYGTGSEDLVFLTSSFSGTLSAGGTQTIIPSEPSQPTALTFSNLTHNNIDLSFTTSGATGYIILRRLGAAVTDQPTDFVTYSVGDDIGSSKVAYVGDAATLPISDGGLNAASEYHYAIFAYNGTGTLTNYNTTSPLVGNRRTLATPPTGHSTTFTALAVSSSQIDLTFNAASTVAANGYLLLRRDDTTSPNATGIVNGIAPNSLVFPSGTTLVDNITNPSQTSYSDNALSAGVRYDYALIPYTWDGVNTATYHYYVSPTIPTTFAITLGTNTTALTIDYSEDIASITVTASGSGVFAFVVTDDNGMGGDMLPTQISQLVITQSTNNDPAFSNWTTLIAGAQLTDGTNTITGTIGTNSITFSGIPTGFGQLGRIEDNASKTYTLNIWLHSNLGALSGTIDNKKIGFRLTESSFVVSGATSYFIPSQTVIGESAVTVDATQLRFVVQPPATAVVGIPMTPAPIVWATDMYGNRDHDYSGTPVVTNAGSLSMSGLPTAFTAGQLVLSTLVYNAVGDGTLTVASSPLTNTTSTTVTVSGLPSVNITTSSFSYTENQPPISVLSGLTISNPTTGLNYAIVEFTSGYAAGQDRLVWTNTPNFTTAWNESVGQLLVTSGLPTSSFVSFLSNVAYVNTSDNPSAALRTLRFYVRNSVGNSNDVFITINVTPVNDAPVLVPKPNLVLFNALEDGGAVVIGVDSLVRATQQSIDAEGSLYGVGINYADTTAGYWAYSLNGGTTWTNFGGVSISDANALLLRNLSTTKLRFIPKSGVNGLFQHLAYRLWDGTDGATEGTFVSMTTHGGTSSFSAEVQQAHVSIRAINDAPSFTLSQTDFSLDEDAPLLIVPNFAQHINDGDSELTQQLQFVLQPITLQGNLTFSVLTINTTTGELQMQPTPNRYGRAMIAVRLYDDGPNGGLDRNFSDQVIFYVDVRPINDAPVLSERFNATLTLLENQKITLSVSDLLNVLYSYTDADADMLGIAIVGQNDVRGIWEYSGNGVDWQPLGGGSLSAAWHLDYDDFVRFTPKTNWNGEILSALQYKLWDRTNGLQGGNVADATFVSDTLAYSLNVQSLRLVVHPVNGLPTFTLSRDTIRILEGAGLVEIANFVSDIDDGDEELNEKITFKISSSGGLNYAQVPAINGEGRLRFEVAENDYGQDTWEIWAEDESGGVSNRVYVKLIVDSVNDVPAFVLSADSLMLRENFVGEVVVEATLVNIPDNEADEEIRFRLSPAPQEISFVQVRFDTLTGRIVLRSLPNRFGAMWLVVTANDGFATYSDSVYVRVIGESFAPTDIALSNDVLIGNPSAGYKVGSLEVEDADELDEHRLSLVAGLGDDDNDKFSIVGEELRTKVRLDYKVQRVFKIRVRAEDELGEFIEEIFTLTMLPPTLSSQDSLTLVELNQFLKSKLPWVGNIPIYEWQGVRIEENKLVGLNLSGFSLDTISVEILRKLDELEELDISGNALDFHDLLPIKTLDIDRLTYSPQKEIGQRRELFIALQADNESIVLHTNPAQPVGSQYQWLRNEEVMVDRSGKIEGSRTSSLVIKEAEEEDGGIFVCEVIHPDLPALKLRTQPLIVNLHQFLLLQDSLALIAIRELFPSRVGGRSEDWTQGYASTWKGVRVQRNRVIGLDLSGRQMKGNFPKEVGNLTALRRLNLFGNQLTGLPKEIGELKQLEYLDLDGNQLKEIPAELFALDKINTLWLARNELESLPAGIERMTGLRNLFLQGNKLKTLPVGLRELNQLEILDISKNALNGELNFVGMNGLKTLRVGENNISSVIVFGLRNLEEVNLDNNELRAFPFSRTEHPKLMKVSVRWNRLTFEDLEEAVLENWTLGYVPQKRFSADEERRVVAGNPVEWLLSVGGTANEYSWYKNGVQIGGQTSNRLFLPTVNVNDAGVYELHVRSNKVAGLELVSGQMRLVVNCGAALVLEGVSSLQFCSNVPVEGRLRVRGGDAQWDYRWYRDGAEQLLMRGPEVVVTLAGTYEVRVKDNNGCERVSNSLKVTVLRAPEVRVKEVSEFVLEAEGEGEGEYQWYRDGFLIEGAKAKRYEVEKRGVYWVKFTSKATGCEAYSEAKKFSITGLSEEELLNAIEIYPNPVREETTISFGETVVGKVQLELINLNGMVLKEWQLDTLEGRSKQLHMSDLASGVYLLRIRHDDVLLIKRLTKQ